LARIRGDLVDAIARYREGLDLARANGDRWLAALVLAGVADVVLARGDPERAACLLGTVASLEEGIGGSFLAFDRANHARTANAARAALGEAAFAAAWAAGRALARDPDALAALAFVSDPPAAPAVGTAPAAFGLSKREREVLALLARRLTDKEIAEALFVSPHTVARHTANLFAKLGVANRREAAALAARHGLV
jgi:non-specific serine/threonine protein kinase